MSYHALAGLVTVRPLSNVRPRPGNRWSQFRAPVGKTVRLLARELEHLQAERVVLELDLRERDIRQDGLPRADARCGDPTVVLSFESKYGPLRYATCEYTHWTDNLRAVALAMEALRAVDRYGVSKRGEQYAGWKAIPQSTDPADTLTTPADAVLAIHSVVGDLYDEADIDGPHLRSAVLEALRRTHPDRGGEASDFRRVMKAKELLGA